MITHYIVAYIVIGIAFDMLAIRTEKSILRVAVHSALVSFLMIILWPGVLFKMTPKDGWRVRVKAKTQK